MNTNAPTADEFIDAVATSAFVAGDIDTYVTLTSDDLDATAHAIRVALEANQGAVEAHVARFSDVDDAIRALYDHGNALGAVVKGRIDAAIASDKLIADMSSEQSVRDWLGDFAEEYSEDAISDIANTYREALEPRRGEIAEALAGLTEGQPVTDVTLSLGLTEALDAAIQDYDAAN